MSYYCELHLAGIAARCLRMYAAYLTVVSRAWYARGRSTLSAIRLFLRFSRYSRVDFLRLQHIGQLGPGICAFIRYSQSLVSSTTYLPSTGLSRSEGGIYCSDSGTPRRLLSTLGAFVAIHLYSSDTDPDFEMMGSHLQCEICKKTFTQSPISPASLPIALNCS
jgi:hypothetical protein